MLNEIKKSNIDLVIGDFFISFFGASNKHRTKSGNELVFSKTTILNKFKINNYMNLYLKNPNKYPLFTMSWGRLFKTSIIKKHNIFFNEKLWRCEDVDFNFRYLIWTDKISFVSNHVVNHSVGNQTLRMRYPKNLYNFFGFHVALKSSVLYLEKMKINKNINHLFSHAFIHYTVIAMIRLAFQYGENKSKTLGLLRESINDTTLQNSLQNYTSLSGESKIIPFLIRKKQPLLLLYFCRIKGILRYIGF